MIFQMQKKYSYLIDAVNLRLKFVLGAFLGSVNALSSFLEIFSIFHTLFHFISALNIKSEYSYKSALVHIPIWKKQIFEEEELVQKKKTRKALLEDEQKQLRKNPIQQ